MEFSVVDFNIYPFSTLTTPFFNCNVEVIKYLTIRRVYMEINMSPATQLKFAGVPTRSTYHLMAPKAQTD